MITPSEYIYDCAGRPDIDANFEPCEVCATCGIQTNSGIPISSIENPTFSQHADFMRYSKHVCYGCAWLYWSGKGKPGNFIAAGGQYHQLVISHESVVEDKMPWIKRLKMVAQMPFETLVSGVLTTDVKPRLWPRTRLATVGDFGLYVHAPDYDLSDYVRFDLHKCLALSESFSPILVSGFAKMSIYHGLLRDYARAGKNLAQTIGWENQIKSIRATPEFIPALLISGVTKEDKKDVRDQKPDRSTGARAAVSDQHHQALPGLF